jgi:serine phosphatase RsbU (regulator of sigma subunit)
LEFAGANQPLIIVTKNGSERISGDRCTLGDMISMKQHLITNHYRQLEPGDRFYLFSDGFIHQFGGEDGKKKYGIKRLSQELQDFYLASGQSVREILTKNFSAWKGNFPQTDDVMLLGMTVGTNKKEILYNA